MGGGRVDTVSKPLEPDVADVGGVGQMIVVYLSLREEQNNFEEIPP